MLILSNKYNKIINLLLINYTSYTCIDKKIILRKISIFLLITLQTLLLANCVLKEKPYKVEKLVHVGVLLPLSGPEARDSREYESMIKLGLQKKAKTKIRLTSYDVSSQKKMENVVEEIIKDNVDIVIGPIYAQSTNNLIKLLKQQDQREMIIMSLSNNPVLVVNYDNLFVLGHSPIKQFEFMIEYFSSKGHEKYMLLLHDNNNTRYTVSKILEHMIKEKNGRLIKSIFYKKDPHDIINSIKEIASIIDEQNEKDYNLSKIVILVTGSCDILPIIYDNFIKNRLDEKAIIAGDSRLNINYKDGIKLLYPSSKAFDYKLLKEELGIDFITFMHEIAYDAGAIVADCIGSNYNRNVFLGKINDPKYHIEGLSGDITITGNIAKRSYSISTK